MIAYGTTYRGGFHATIWARSEDERDTMITLRGMGEHPSAHVPDDPPASTLFERHMVDPSMVHAIDVAHALVYLGFLATSCGLDHGLHDLGWHHEAIHWLSLRRQNAHSPEWRATLDRIRSIERAIPGHIP